MKNRNNDLPVDGTLAESDFSGSINKKPPQVSVYIKVSSFTKITFFHMIG
jgi:hypothetical protein